MTLSVNIHKKLKGFRLHVEFDTKNESLGILGASGCGKSMTLRCIAGIETPDSGRIVLNGRVLYDSEKKINLPPQERRVGYLFQNYALFPNMSVKENIVFASKVGKKEKNEIAEKIITDFKLQGLEDKKPHQISGGQQQRTALARLLVNQPEILLFDEPFSALDTHLRAQMEQFLINVIEDYNGSILIVSHNRGEIYRMCEKIAVYSTGKIDVIDTRENVFKNPKTLSSAVLTGCKNISRARVINEHEVEALDWGTILTTQAIIPDNIEYIGIRAKHIRLTNEKGHENPTPFQLVHKTESPFCYLLMFKHSDQSNIDETKLLRCDIRKDIWNMYKNENVYLQFPEEKLLFLTA